MSKLLPAIAATAVAALRLARRRVDVAHLRRHRQRRQSHRTGRVRRERDDRLAGADHVAVQALRRSHADHDRRSVREGVGPRPGPGRQRDRRDRPPPQAAPARPRDHRRHPARTISDNTHSADAPTLYVAPDGTAVAAWAWHDTGGWRAQVAIRRPGQARFDKPQTVSPPAPGRQRPFVRVAAGEGGRAILTWQVQTGGDAPLHVLTAGETRPSAPIRCSPAAAAGPTSRSRSARPAPSTSPTWTRRAARPACGSPPAPPARRSASPSVLATGGKGTSSGTQVATAFSADGTATVAWGKPGSSYEDGGTLEVFTRAPGAATFGAAQTLAQRRTGSSSRAAPAPPPRWPG